MSKSYIFDSLSKPIPEIRRDLQVIPIQENGSDLLYFYDSMGYLTPNFALDRKVEPILSLLTGHQSINQITTTLNSSLSDEDLLHFVQLLDTHKALDSELFQHASEQTEEEFENSGSRKPAFAGETYPADPQELKEYLKGLLTESKKPISDSEPVKALYAPHIDLRVGNSAYGEAFSSLRHLKPKRVVILATAHYPGYYGDFYEGTPFIGSRKNFELPGRELKTDQKAMERLAENSSGFTLNDRAHRIEHSIELHLLFISHLWKHDFEIMPVLVSGFDELFYYSHSDLGEKVDSFSSQIRSLDNGNTFFLISGDLSHVGKKFGDVLPANSIREKVEQVDQQFIEHAVQGDHKKLLQQVGSDYDSTRICGFSPLYTFLKAFPESEGKLINYSWWDEKERESAVSYGSICY